MRPIHLRFENFGSYPNAAEIDFAALEQGGIFLICGPTGSGKTTLLDAMCCALYGKASGSQRAKQWSALRYSGAAPRTRTSISFTFALGSQKYRYDVYWTAASGSFNFAAYRLDESGETLIESGGNSRLPKVSEELIGLTYEQFVKVIMLPQGEFRELLTADSKTKQALLEKLFAAQRWSGLIQRARERRNQLKAQLEQLRAGQSALLSSLSLENAEELDAALTAADASLVNARKTQDEAARALEQSEQKIGRQRALLTQFEELERAVSLCHTLEARRGEVDTLRNTVAESDRLREAREPYTLLVAAEKELAQAETAAADAKALRDRAEERNNQAQNALSQLPDMRQTLETTRGEITNISQSMELLPQLDEINEKIAQDSKKRSELETQIAELDRHRGEVSGRIDNGERVIADTEKLAAQLAQRTDIATRLTHSLAAARARQKLSEQLAAQEKEAVELESRSILLEAQSMQAYESARQLEEGLRGQHTWLLAQNLTEGQPCPVCGSLHHPSLAEAAQDAPSAQDVERARKSADEKNREYQQACLDAKEKQTSCAMLRSQRTQYDDELRTSVPELGGECVSLDQLEEAARTAEDNRKESAQASDNIARFRAAVTQLREEWSSISSQIDNAKDSLAQADASLAALNVQRESLAGRILVQGDAPHLAAMLAQAQKRESDIQASIEKLENEARSAAIALEAARARQSAADEQCAKAEQTCHMRAEELCKKCLSLGIAESREQFERMPTFEKVQQLREEISQFEQQEHAANASRSALEAALANVHKPDMSALEAAHEEKRHASENAIAATAALEGQLERLRRVQQEMLSFGAQYDAVEVQFGTVKLLLEHIDDGNARKMPISQYVIGLMLDEVIDLANAYLEPLTRGQFCLTLAHETSGGARSQGLDFRVIDNHLGVERLISSLSGGETFLASLSLALGLSQVVQECAGGVRLDSLFIDEGFGSLDAASLDLAVSALMEIRSERLVGIISHVNELRERIGTRIEIERTLTGSRLTVVI